MSRIVCKKCGKTLDSLNGELGFCPYCGTSLNPQSIVAAGATATVESLIERVFMFLEEGNFNQAAAYCERILDIEPKNAEAYLGRFMATLRIRKRKDIILSPKPLETDINYRRAIEYGDDKLKTELAGYIEAIQNRGLEQRYALALAKMQNAYNEQSFYEAARAFGAISSFQDAAEKEKQCIEGANYCIWAEAEQCIKRDSVSSLEKAIQLLTRLPDSKSETTQKIADCEIRIDELKKQRKKRKHRWFVRSGVVLGVVLILVLSYFWFIKEMIVTWKLQNCEVGEYITFGEYEQDGDTSNGKEAIEWLVLEKQDDKILVVSKYVLDSKAFHGSDEENITWENCDLRRWLNIDFVNSAFSEEEKQRIPTASVEEQSYHGIDANQGNDTKDKVFLLSAGEAEYYFGDSNERRCKPTQYTLNKNIILFDEYCWWWLRTSAGTKASQVDGIGYILTNGYNTKYDDGVRPAMWIKFK